MPVPTAAYSFPPLARKVERADGPATVLAIGTASPPNVFDQSTFPDFYFNITNTNHMTDSKEKLQRICDKSGIKKRCMHLSEEILKANPSMCAYSETSLDVRQDMVVAEVPKLGAQAASKAITEWGQPKSKITHLVFCTTSGVDMPGADWVLTKLLGLRSSVKRLMMYQQGCFGGGTVMRAAKDLAENNKGARVLVVCSELTQVLVFRGPTAGALTDSQLVVQALFGDGAAAVIVGADPIPQVERPWFEIHYAASNILPDSDGAIKGHVREVGLMLHLMKEVPEIIAKSIDSVLKDSFKKVFGDDAPSYNDMFWITHPGGRAILDRIEEKLELETEKLASSRQVLSDFGNVISACVLFVMDDMRRKSVKQKLATTGEGHEWGLLLGFGPGLTCETVVLRSVPLPTGA